VEGRLTESSLCVGLLILIGLDLKISSMRWKIGVKDLNPIVNHFAKNHGMRAGLLALGGINLLVMAAATLYPSLLWMLLGGKLSLASLQIRSLIENEYSNPR
jgi:hypothetical protein